MKRGYRRYRGEVELWRGRQWAVTDRRVVSLKGPAPYNYDIPAAKLGQIDAASGWGWLDQVGLKLWCDFDDFAEAFRVACEYHKVTIAPEVVARSIARVRAARQPKTKSRRPKWSEAVAQLTSTNAGNGTVH